MIASAESARGVSGGPKRGVAAILAVVLTLLSAGLEPYQACAANLKNTGVSAGTPKVQLAPIPGLPQPVIGQIPGSAAASAAIKTPQADPAQAQAKPETTEGALRLAGAELAAAGGSAQAQEGVLQRLFTKRFFSSEPEAAPVVAVEPAPALKKLDVAELKALAGDAGKPEADRRAAVKAIADRSDDPSRLALEEIGTRLGGSSTDYEIKRLALRRLAEQGTVRSLTPVSAEHAAEILSKLSAAKPEALAVDLDSTLTEGGAPVSAQTAAVLKAAAAADIETMILSDRPAANRSALESGVAEAFAELPADQRAHLTLAAHRGAELLTYDANGQASVLSAADGWTTSQRKDIQKAVHAAARNAGVRLPRADFVGAYDAFVALPVDMSDAALAKLNKDLAQFTEGLAASSTARRAKTPGDAPYLFVSKYDKSLGVGLLRRQRERLLRLRDVARFVPKVLQPLARRLFGMNAGRVVPAEATLLIGDQFMGERTGDAAMLKAAPGALALAVGGSADPRHDNVFVWPSQGPDAARQIIGALIPAAPAKGAVSSKAKWGFFSQRTAGMAVFAFTGVAFAGAAIPTVGMVGFAALMAFGSLAAIMTGPLNGLVAKKLSSRDATLFNAAVRIVLHSALPLFWIFGILNFWTLLIAAVANGWLLSSIVSTDNVLLQRLFGKDFPTFNNLAWINYLLIQVVMLILVGFEHFVAPFVPVAASLGMDMSDPMAKLMIPFMVSALVHAVVVAPIAGFTIPNEKAAAVAPAQDERRAQDLGHRLLRFARRYWHALTALGLSLAMYFYAIPGLPSSIGSIFVGSPIPVALAAVWWISRTDGFKAWWANTRARGALSLAALGALLYYPIQGYLLPMASTVLASAASSKEQLYGELLGALFFGQLISNAGKAKLMPRLRLPLIGHVDTGHVLKGAILATAAVWAFVTLFPGVGLAAVAVAAAAGGLMALSARMTDRAWVRYLGLGMAVMALPWALSGSVAALFAAALAFGLFYGPASVVMSSQFYASFPPAQREAMSGVQSSIFNAAITIGFALLQALNLRHPGDLHGLLGDVALLTIASGLTFFIGIGLLPGLLSKNTKQEIKK